MSKVDYRHQLPVIIGARNGYLKSVGYLYEELKKRFVARREADSLKGVISNPGEISALVSNIAFSIELSLKALRIQDNPDCGPRGHDFYNLWRPLSREVKNMAGEKYEEFLASWDEREPLTYVAFGNNMDSAKIPQKTLDDALQNLKNSFVDWRYMYEVHGGSKRLKFNFIEANCALKALVSASNEFNGSDIVQSSWN